MPTLPEATALFELGRRWRYVHHAFAPPADSAGKRKQQLQDFLVMAGWLAIPVDKSSLSAAQDSQTFYKQIPEIYVQLLMATAIARGHIAAKLVQAGALYVDLFFKARRSSAQLKEGLDEFRKLFRELGVSNKEAAVPLKAVERACLDKKPSGIVEHGGAMVLGDALARAASKQGIKVGQARLDNVVELPSGARIVLPKSLVGYREEIEVFLKKHRYEQNVFLMMPFRETTVQLRAQLRRVCSRYKLNLVIADETRIVVHEVVTNVLSCLLSCKFGIAVFTRPEAKQTINPNVAYELGMMHRDDKVCLILKDKRLKTLPTDLVDKYYTNFVPKDHQELLSHVETWIQDRILQPSGG